MAEDFGVLRLEFLNNVALIRFVNGQNRVNGPLVRAFNKALDAVESNSNVKALITTGEGKFYSNGLDIDWFLTVDQKTLARFFQDLNELLHRLLVFPMPTIAAISGHAFAAGGILALVHDYRVMKTESGWLCLNEVHIKLRFSEFMLELFRSKVPSGPVFSDLAVLGRRFTAKEALSAGLVTQVTSQEKLIEKSLDLARHVIGKQGYDRVALGNMKNDVYTKVIAVKDVPRKGANDFSELMKAKSKSKL